MPVKHEIEIVITPEGEVKLDIRGMKGPSCVAELERFALGLGAIKSIDKNAEFFQSSQSRSQDQRRT
ncbi:MAG: DUF2997 domain-containing protein [Elusimicrobia bacterium]|nr:DUF2997 domain-containing protein [Elusimicrobiota bacterium]